MEVLCITMGREGSKELFHETRSFLFIYSMDPIILLIKKNAV